jgi:hypothetical protein
MFKQNFLYNSSAQIQDSTLVSTSSQLMREILENKFGVLFVYSNSIVLCSKTSTLMAVPYWKSQLLWLPKFVDVESIGLMFIHTTLNASYIVDAQGKSVFLTLSTTGFSNFSVAEADMLFFQNQILSNIDTTYCEPSHNASSRADVALNSNNNAIQQGVGFLNSSYPFTKSYVGVNKNKGRPSNRPPKR